MHYEHLKALGKTNRCILHGIWKSCKLSGQDQFLKLSDDIQGILSFLPWELVLLSRFPIRIIRFSFYNKVQGMECVAINTPVAVQGEYEFPTSLRYQEKEFLEHHK